MFVKKKLCGGGRNLLRDTVKSNSRPKMAEAHFLFTLKIKNFDQNNEPYQDHVYALGLKSPKYSGFEKSPPSAR